VVPTFIQGRRRPSQTARHHRQGGRGPERSRAARRHPAYTRDDRQLCGM